MSSLLLMFIHDKIKLRTKQIMEIYFITPLKGIPLYNDITQFTKN